MAYFDCIFGGGSSGGGYELTVTCDADFAGTTITATDGVTTLTQTCPSSSPYEVVFEIPNGGDWTISGVVSGQTITTGVNIPTTATLEAIVQKTITIYSAKEDTITYTDVYGDTQTEVFASGQTSKQITIDINISGSSITFTSGVAKDPSNLSNYYSKTVTIDSNSTDVYLMPDNVIYWYGFENVIYGGMDYTAYPIQTNAITGSPMTQNTNCLSCTASKTSSSFNADAQNTVAMDDFTKVYAVYRKGTSGTRLLGSNTSLSLTGNKYVGIYAWGNGSSNWFKVAQGTAKSAIRSTGGDMINIQIDYNGTFEVSALWFE